MNADENVVAYPTNPEAIARLRANAEARNAARPDKRQDADGREDELRRRYEAAKAQLEAANGKALPEADRLLLARNLGRLAVSIAGKDRGLKLATDYFGDTARQYRQRWVRFEGEPIELKDEADIAAQRKGAKGGEYRRIAMHFAAKSSAPNFRSVTEREAILRLLKGTSFDPRPDDIVISADQNATLSQLFEDMRREMLKAVPQLGSYFGHVAGQALQHPFRSEGFAKFAKFDRDDATFVPVASITAFGEATLVPEHLHDGLFLTEESNGIENLFPRVELGVLRVAVATRGVVLDEAEQIELAAAPEGGHTAVGEKILARHGSPDDARVFRTDIAEDWSLHLVAAPFGGIAPGNIALALVAVRREDEADPGLTEIPGWPSDAPSVFLRSEGGEVTRVTIRDGASLARSASHLLLQEMDERLWKADGDTAMKLLLSPLAPPDCESLNNGTQLTFVPDFAGADGFAPLPAASIAGLLARNNRPVAGDRRVVRRLIDDALMRAGRLQAQLEEWTRAYEAERLRHAAALQLYPSDEEANS